MFIWTKLLLLCVMYTFAVQSVNMDALIDKNDKYLTLLHFNDAYNVNLSPQFAKKFLAAAEDKNSVKLFSGDIYSPAKETRYFRGSQFDKFFEFVKLDAAGVGNHEFDLGVKQFLSLNKNHNIPWTLFNIAKDASKSKNENAADTAELLKSVYKPIIIERNGIKIGTFGMFDEESFKGSRLTRTDLQMEDPIARAAKISKKLRVDGCHLIILLSHMTNKSDREILKDSNNDVDLVLGGHDHEFRVEVINNRFLVKSGFDFLEFSKSKVWFTKKPLEKQTPLDKGVYSFLFDQNNQHSAPNPFTFSLAKGKDLFLNIQMERVKVSEADPVHPEISTHVKDVVEKKMKEIDSNVAFALNFKQEIKEDIDRKFSFPLYRFLVDLLRAHNGYDMAAENTGGFRLYRKLASGYRISALDLDSLFPFEDDLLVVRIKSEKIPAMLNDVLAMENDGAAMAGVTYSYRIKNGKKTLIEESIRINGKELEAGREYSLITNSYFGSGKGLPSLGTEEIQKTKKILSGTNEQKIVMDSMSLISKEEMKNEFSCFKSRFPVLRSDGLVKYFKRRSAQQTESNFCDASKKKPWVKSDQPQEHVLDILKPEVFQRLMIYAMMSNRASVKLDDGSNLEYYYANLDIPETATLIQKII